MDVRSVGSAVNQGLIGLQRSQADIAQSATKIAEAATNKGGDVKKSDVTEPLLNIKAQSQVFDASAKIVKAANDSIGTLLHVKA